MSITTHTNTLPLVTESELRTYQLLAKIVASNPHWRALGGETKEKKLPDEEIISTVTCVMLLAREIGLLPMSAIAYGIYNVKGKFEISARGMNQLIRQRRHSLQIVEHTSEYCKIWGKRWDTGEELECTYHIDEARRAGLVKAYGAWFANPEDMVFARCISRIGRRLFADCIGGFYIEGELKESVLKQTVETIEVPSADQVNTTEIEVQAQSPAIVFELPEDLTRESLSTFIRMSAETSGKPEAAVIVAANKFPEKFINAFRTWEDKRNPLIQEQVECQEINV